MYDSRLLFTLVLVSVCLVFIIYLIYFVTLKRDRTIDELGIKYNEHSRIMGDICRERCGHKTCREYHERLHHYHMCHHCHQKGKCYDNIKNRCIPCSHWELKKSCKTQYGCQNPKGFMHPDVAPINPAQTHCQPCWQNQNEINL